MLALLAPLAERFVTVTAHNPRAMPAQTLAEHIRAYGCTAEAADSIEAGVARAEELGGEGPVCALGIQNAEPPVQAIRKKKQSSLVVGMNMVKQREADAFVSAGSSGAVLVGGQTIVGRIRGIKRPPLAPIIPTETGISLLIDCGANVDARPDPILCRAIFMASKTNSAREGSIYFYYRTCRSSSPAPCLCVLRPYPRLRAGNTPIEGIPRCAEYVPAHPESNR